jgi:hypothetical protein
MMRTTWKKIGMGLFLAALILTVCQFLPFASSQKSITVNLANTYQWLSAAEREVISHSGMDSFYESCKIQIQTNISPFSWVGKKSGIGASVEFLCPQNFILPESVSLTLRSRISDNMEIIQPGGELDRPITQLENSDFVWTIRNTRSGDWQGVIWLYLDQNYNHGSATSFVLGSIPVSISFRSIAGLSYPLVWWIIGCLALIGGICLFLPLALKNRRDKSTGHG